MGAEACRGRCGWWLFVSSLRHKLTSYIDDSHKKPILAIEWLPDTVEIERRGKAHEGSGGLTKYFLTLAGDGQVLIWDFKSALDSMNEPDFVWKPVHRIQLTRQDSGTEMGCCHLLYCDPNAGFGPPKAGGEAGEETGKKKDKEEKMLTNFWASTEEGELIFGDWAAKAEEDRKPENCKKLLPPSKTFRPMVSLERSPFFPNILLAVTDWSFFLFKEDQKNHLFQSCSPSSYFTCGTWSPTRPGVILLGRMDGQLEIWDFSDQSHKPSLTHGVTSVAITSLVFLKAEAKQRIPQRLAVGDEQGHLHVLEMPTNLTRQAGKEKESIATFLEREEKRINYFAERRGELFQMMEEKEKEADAAEQAESESDAQKLEAEKEAMDKAEAEYKQLEALWMEEIAAGS